MLSNYICRYTTHQARRTLRGSPVLVPQGLSFCYATLSSRRKRGSLSDSVVLRDSVRGQNWTSSVAAFTSRGQLWTYYYVVCVSRALWLPYFSALFSRNAHGPVTETADSHIANNLLTSKVCLHWKIDELTSRSLGQYGMVSIWDFPVTTSLSVNK